MRSCCVLLFCAVVRARFIFTDFQKDKIETSNDVVLNPVDRDTQKSICESQKSSALIERFFNMIFSEFHTTPPACVCVQMCPEQPTYCYPNGCFRRSKRNRKPDVPLTRVNENVNPIFFVDERYDFLSNLFEANNDVGVYKLAKPTPNRHDLFQEKYKNLYKFKRPQKVEIKYNRGEQIRNVMRSQNLDVSKSRWPLNKKSKNVNEQFPEVLPAVGSSRFLNLMLPSKEVKFPLKYFKRELVFNDTHHDDNTNVENNATNDILDIEHNIFSLEKLIDSLIDDKLMPNNTLVDLVNLADDTDLKVNKRNSKTILNDNDGDFVKLDNATDVISMNNTNENTDKNKYIENDAIQNKTETYSTMIATLSKRIDEQNNTSLEMAKRLVGDEYEPGINEKATEMITLNTYIDNDKMTQAGMENSTWAIIDTYQTNIGTTQPNLETTQINLETTRANIETTRANIATTRTNLETTQGNVEITTRKSCTFILRTTKKSKQKLSRRHNIKHKTHSQQHSGSRVKPK